MDFWTVTIDSKPFGHAGIGARNIASLHVKASSWRNHCRGGALDLGTINTLDSGD